MSEQTISALLATAALLVVPAAFALVLAVGLQRAADLRELLDRHAQVPAFAIAATAMAGSLYYSEIAHFVPCEFCWFQRIAMYPLAVLLLVGVATRATLPARFVVVPAAIGLLISVYHYQLQLFPEQTVICTGAGAPCTLRYVDELGFVSIPFMAGCGFAAILLIYLARWRAGRMLDS